jgi:hypothetical protein
LTVNFLFMLVANLTSRSEFSKFLSFSIKTHT